MSRLARPLVSVLAVLALAAGSVFVAGEAAYAADPTITVTPSATSVPSNTIVTYTLTVSCSTTGGCTGTTVSFPTASVSGDGSVTSFASWVKNGTCPAMTTPSGEVSFNYGTLATGTRQCTFTVAAPEYKTLDQAQVTITPTLTSSNSATVTGTPATLTLTAGHNDQLLETVPPTALTGGSFQFTLQFYCGADEEYTGDVGLSALDIEDQLPANFTYTGYTTRDTLSGTITPPAVGSSGGTFSYSGDGSDCANPPLNNDNRILIYVVGTASTGGAADTVGDTVCNTASSTFTYIDGTPDSSTSSPAACAQVVNVATTATKVATSNALANAGQYTVGGSSYPYTYPGNWDSAGNSGYDLTVATNPQTLAAGVSYELKDPLPCLDNLAANIYTSNAPGVACAHPGFVPTLLTAPQGFTPTTSDVITLLYTDGSTGTVSYVSGTGWTIPTSPAVSEIDIPAFPEEGANTVLTMVLHVKGYASADAQPSTVLRNSMTSQPFPSGDSTPITAARTATGNLIVADPAAPTGGTVLYPGITTAAATGTCMENVYIDSPSNSVLTNQIEITSAPSQAIYVDYLSPEGSTGATGTTQTFSLTGKNGHTYSSGAITPTITANYNDTGRTRYQWTIPAGAIQVPGTYVIHQSATIVVSLEAGCAGTYQNDLTLGYGAPVTKCVFDNYGGSMVQNAPMNPASDGDLDANGSPIAGNYCGFSKPLVVAPVNPGFTVNKTVQGNLDADPVSAGGVGDISPAGGTATYKVSFTNTGLSNLHDPVMYDLLPRVGDTEASTTTPRGSEFPVTLTDVGTLPSGVIVSYSTAANPCRPEVLASNSGCVDDWSTVAPSPLSDTTALKITYVGTVDVDGTFTVPYTVSTPTTAVGKIAWNSVGTNVYAGDNLLGAAESAVTGLEATGGEPSITKAADASSFDSTDDTIGYTYTVTNNAAVPLTGVGVTDNLTDAASDDTAPTVTCQSLSNPADTCSGATTTLAPGQVATFTASYPVTQGDLDHGVIKDTATVTGQPPTGGPLSNTSNEVTVNSSASAGLSLTKTATPTSVSAANSGVTFHFAVTNTGSETVHGIAIDEGDFTGSGTLGAVTCDATVLAPTASTTCSATYTTTQADIDSDAASIDNTATATGLDPADTPVASDSSTATVDVEQAATMTLTKTATPNTVGQPGDSIDYEFLIHNTGNVTLTDVGVNEGVFSGTGDLSDVSCPTTVLAPGASTTCTADYTVTQDDVDAGTITNHATATAAGPGILTSTSSESTSSVPVIQSAELSLTKTADVHTVTASGQKIGYSFHIVNGGNVSVSGIGVQETSFTGSGSVSDVSCPSDVLAPGADMMCTASYTVTKADLGSKAIVNTAVATGLLTASSLTSDPSTARVTVDAPATPAGGLAFTGVTGVAGMVGGGILLLGLGALFMALGIRRGRRNA